MIAIVAALAAIPAGLAIDALAAPLAAEWYTSSADADDERPHREGPPPALLTTQANLRRALVVATAILIFALLGTQYGASWRLVVVSAYASVFVACTETDLLAHRIPNIIVYPAILFALAIGLTVPGADTSRVLLGGLLSGGVFFAMALLPGGGLGDAKLGLFAGLVLALELATMQVFITAITGGIAAFGFLLVSRFGAWKRPLAYGPYIAFGAVAVMLLGGTAFERL